MNSFACLRSVLLVGRASPPAIRENAMKPLPASDPLAQALRQLVGTEGISGSLAGEVYVESLPSSRQVLRFTLPEGNAVVGKFFSAYPPQVSADLSLAREYDNYRRLPALGLTNGQGLVPRLLGRWPQGSLGLLLEAVPGPDLDNLIRQACLHGDPAPLYAGPGKTGAPAGRFSLPAGSGACGRARPRPGLPG